MEFKECDIILVHKNPPYKLQDIPAPVIRYLTKCYYNHVAIIVMFMGDLWVMEAIGKGFVVTMKVDQYKKRIGNEIEICVLEPKVPRSPEVVYSNMSDIVNKSYDFLSLLWYQLKYQISGGKKWKGKTGDKAEKSVYCSEAVAEAFPDIFPEPWLVTPADIFRSNKLKIVYESNPESRFNFEKSLYL